MKIRCAFLTFFVVTICVIAGSCGKENESYSYAIKCVDLMDAEEFFQLDIDELDGAEYSIENPLYFFTSDGYIGMGMKQPEIVRRNGNTQYVIRSSSANYIIIADPEEKNINTLTIDPFDNLKDAKYLSGEISDEIVAYDYRGVMTYYAIHDLPGGGYICIALSAPMTSRNNTDDSDKNPDPEYDYGGRIIRYSPEGEVVISFRMVDIDPDLNVNLRSSVNQSSVKSVYSNGKLYILIDKIIYIIDENGTLLSKIAIPEDMAEVIEGSTLIYKTSLSLDTQERVLLTCPVISGSAVKYGCFQITEKGIGKQIEIPDTGIYQPYFGFGYDVFYYDDIGFCGVDNGGEPVRLFEWLDVDLTKGMISYVNVVSDERIYVVTSDNKAALIYMTMDAAADSKKILKVAYEENNLSKYVTDLMKYARSFNLSNDEYRIKLCPYNGDENRTANEKLRLDMVKGQVPDIVMFGGGITPEDFLRFDLFADIYDFMDSDGEYSRELFVPCLLEPVETKDGHLPYLIVGYYFETLIGKTSVIGDKTVWSLDDISEMISGLSDDQYLMRITGDDPQGAMLGTILPAVLGQYIDYENARCDFTGGFAELLKACGSAPICLTESMFPDAEQYVGGKVILCQHIINNLLVTECMKFQNFADEDVTFIGYPRDDDASEGTMLVPTTGFAIAKQSENQSGAWEFIKWFLNECEKDTADGIQDIDEYQTTGLPVTRTVMDMLLSQLGGTEYSCVPVTSMLTGRKSVAYRVGVIRKYDLENEDDAKAYELLRTNVSSDGGVIRKITDEDISELRRLMENVTVVKSNDTATMGIIKEEASAYFAGAQTLERTVEIITDRVQTRLSE